MIVRLNTARVEQEGTDFARETAIIGSWATGESLMSIVTGGELHRVRRRMMENSIEASLGRIQPSRPPFAWTLCRPLIGSLGSSALLITCILSISVYAWIVRHQGQDPLVLACTTAQLSLFTAARQSLEPSSVTGGDPHWAVSLSICKFYFPSAGSIFSPRHSRVHCIHAWNNAQ